MALYLGTNEVGLAGPFGGYMINGRLIAEKTYSFNLGQTNYSSLTPTTTAQALTLPATTYTINASTSVQVIRIGQDFDGTIIDRNTHDYVVFCYVVINYNYGNNNVSSAPHIIRSVYGRDFQGGKYRNTINSSNGQLNDTYTKGSSYITSATSFLYQKADGTYAITTGTQGIYGQASASVTTAGGHDYFYIQASGFSVKANDSYCPVDSLTAINPANTIITISCEVYEGDRSSYTNIYDKIFQLAANT